MTTDILSLQRSELVRIINSCGFGDVLSMQQFRYYCGNNDIRGTNGQGVSLLRYAALLTLEWFQPAVRARDYIEQKRLQAERSPLKVANFHWRLSVLFLCLRHFNYLYLLFSADKTLL